MQLKKLLEILNGLVDKLENPQIFIDSEDGIFTDGLEVWEGLKDGEGIIIKIKL